MSKPLAAPFSIEIEGRVGIGRGDDQGAWLQRECHGPRRTSCLRRTAPGDDAAASAGCKACSVTQRRAIHSRSSGRDGSDVALHCGQIEMLDSARSSKPRRPLPLPEHQQPDDHQIDGIGADAGGERRRVGAEVIVERAADQPPMAMPLPLHNRNVGIRQ